jgi:hypothetical protein
VKGSNTVSPVMKGARIASLPRPNRGAISKNEVLVSAP